MSVPNTQTYHYQRHEPEKTTLYKLIQANWLTFQNKVEQDLGYPLPDFVIKEFEEYLRCGILAVGNGRYPPRHCPPCPRHSAGRPGAHCSYAKFGRRLRLWGALQLGAIPTLFPSLTEKLDAEVYRRNMAQLIDLSQVKVVLTSDDFAVTLREVTSCPVYGTSDLPLDVPSPSFTPPDPDSIAFLQHSSGTTGLQKGVALTHTAVLNQLAAYSQAIALHADDVVVTWLPLYYDMGLIAGFLLPLVQGLPLVLLSPFDWVQHPALLLQAIDRYRGTLCWLPNFAYNHCARRIRRRDKEAVSLASMRLFINCSEPVRHSSHKLFLDAFAAQGVTPDRLGVSYAMAEKTFAVSQTLPGQPAPLDWIDGQLLAEQNVAQPVEPTQPEAVPLVSCGRPISGTAVAIVDWVSTWAPRGHR